MPIHATGLSEDRKQQITDALAKHPNAVASQGGGLVVWSRFQMQYIFVLAPEDMPELFDMPLPEGWGTGPTSMAS